MTSRPTYDIVVGGYAETPVDDMGQEETPEADLEGKAELSDEPDEEA